MTREIKQTATHIRLGVAAALAAAAVLIIALQPGAAQAAPGGGAPHQLQTD